MKVVNCTTQQAGECADALRTLLKGPPPVDEDGDAILSARETFALSDLLVALEDAERAGERRPPVAVGEDDREYDLGGSD